MDTYLKYVGGVIGSVLVLCSAYLMLYNALCWMGLKINRLPFEELYSYQLEKADRSEAITVFVGDSALGNAINADLYSKLSGEKAENLALTSKFGYRGSLDMLQEVRAHNKALRRVVIMHTVHMMSTPEAAQYKPSRPLFKTDHFRGLFIDIFNFQTVKILFKSLYNREWASNKLSDYLINDYIKQGKPLSPEDQRTDLSASRIHREKAKTLKEIAVYCKQENLKCLYVHAPIVDFACRNGGSYFVEINKYIAASGLTLVSPKPLCLTSAQVGDSDDHVRPEYKDDFTKAYYDLLD